MQRAPSAAAAATLTEECSADPHQDPCTCPHRESSFLSKQTPDQQQQQHSASACCHYPHHQPQRQSLPEAAEMAACSTDSRAAPPAAGRAGGLVSITPSSAGRSSLYDTNAITPSPASEQSVGHHMHQLSFELNEQLHVDPKRTRTAPSCCSLCKASQPGESSCTAPSDQTASRLTAGKTPSGAQQAAPEASQCGAASAEEGTATGGKETPALAPKQQTTGDDCCLNCSCPCHNGSSSSSIVCFQGPRRPPTFAANLAELCKTFPSVHQGLIVSLLETADNDLQRAYALVRVVSDTNTGLHNSKTGGPMTKRKRCPDDSECLGSLEGPPGRLSAWAPHGPQGNGDNRRGSCGMDIADERPPGVNFFPEQQQQQQQQPNSPAGVSGAAGAGGAAASGELVAPRGPTGAPARFCMPLGSGLLPEAWCDEVAERLLWAIVTAASGDDAKTKAAALLKEHAAQLASAHHEAPPFQAELPKEAERQELAKRVEMLQNDKLLLARVVKAQHEKLQTLQQNLAAKTEEARHLMQELTGAQQRLRSLRDAAAALVLGASATRNGPCRDNSFDRRFPDVF